MGRGQASGRSSKAHDKPAKLSEWLISLWAWWEGWLSPIPRSSLMGLRQAFRGPRRRSHHTCD